MGKAEQLTSEALLLFSDALRLIAGRSEKALQEAQRTNDLLAEIAKALVGISRQNGEISEQMRLMVERANDHERKQRESSGKIAILERKYERLDADIADLKRLRA